MRAISVLLFFLFFFFNDTATTEIYTLSLHDALPICPDFSTGIASRSPFSFACSGMRFGAPNCSSTRQPVALEIGRATSELQSLAYLVCRLLLEKKKIKIAN